MQTAIAYADSNFTRFLTELKQYLRIPSISTLPAHKADMQRAAEWTAVKLRAIGMDTVEVVATDGHPIVYGEWLRAANAPTVLIYGHYDVQPADPLSEWQHDPFDPLVMDGHIVARGSADDKGQVFINLAAIEALLTAHDGQLPINVKFVIEGEEEVGSAGLAAFVQSQRDRVAADVVVISDTTMLSLEQPAISTAFRGLLYAELEVFGPAFDLHSGQHGGVVHNPIQALCEIAAGLHRADGSVAVDGFYDRVQPLSEIERAELAGLYSDDELRAETGAPAPWGEPAFSLRERIVARPTLEFNGIVGGWTGEGRKTVLPARALAKISCRLVPDQDPAEIAELLRARVAELTPPTVRSEFRVLGSSQPVVVAADNPAMRIAMDAYEKGFGVRPILMRKGGSLPILSTFASVLDVPIILAGYGLPSDRVHGPNERFYLECLRKGIRTAIHLYEGLSAYRPVI
ncbi:MAG: dipeptidase [Chloroflexi bacterium]|nr:dipeptidase [Chloroflexota bacterium]